MTTNRNNSGKGTLERIALRVMTERGFLVDFSEAALNELEKISHADRETKSPLKDLRHLLWASIDNDDSRDLDQLTMAETLPNKTLRIFVAVANKETRVRIFHPPIEGRLLHGHEGVDVGNRLRVQLIHTDVEKGYIDFKKIQ